MLNSLRAKILFIMLAIVLLTTATSMFFSQREIKRAMTHAESESARNALHLAMITVESEYNNLLFHRESMLEKYRTQLQDLDRIVTSYIDGYYKRSERGLLSEKRARNLAAKSTAKLRYGGDNYFFIIDKDFIVISHPDPAQAGTNILDLKDVDGKYIGRTLVDTAIRRGSGFAEYSWKKLGDDKPQKKLTHVSYYPGWEWIIGTGVYIDKIEDEARRKFENMILDLKESFAKITISKTGYLFVFNGKKQVLIHPTVPTMATPGFINPVTGGSLGEELMEASKQPDVPYEYLWDKPSDKGNYEFWKESYVSYFKPLDWYIASSVYRDEINAPAIALYKKLFYASLILFIAAAVLSVHFARSVSVPITNLVDTMKHNAGKGLSLVKAPVGGTREIKELGNIFNNMLASIDTAVKQKEESEKAVRENIELAAIGKTASMLLHDVKRPFTSIRYFLNMLDHYKDDSTKLLLAKREVERSIRGADTMISGVMDLSREAHLETKATALTSILELSLSQTMHDGEKTRVSFKYDIHNTYKPLVDEARIVRAFSNIISNALEAISSSDSCAQGIVTIASKDWSEEDRPYVEISIGNDGPELSSEDISNAFKPFYTRGKTHGTGLGLASTHKIVSLHEGWIAAENIADGTGVVFTIRLPSSREEEEHDTSRLPATTNARIPLGADRHDVEKTALSLFIVDDMMISRNCMKETVGEALKDYRLDIHTFEDPSSALAQFDRIKPDLVISDFDFGRNSEQTGVQFFEAIRVKSETVPLFMASNLAATQLERNASRARATGHFRTSVSPDELRSILTRHIG